MTLDELMEMKKNLQVSQKNNKTQNSNKDSSLKQSENIVKKVAKSEESLNIKKIEGNFPKKGVLKLKVRTLSPIHIGTGSVYEPTNFIIDNAILYHFKDEDFFSSLSPVLQEQFLGIISNNKEDTFARINKFVKDNKEFAIKCAFEKIPASQALQKDYDKKVGEIVQNEGKGKSLTQVFNKFEIQKIQKNLLKTKDNQYFHRAYISGSTLKGAISTAFQEFVYKKEGEELWKEKFLNPKTITEHVFKNFKVADSRFFGKLNSKIAFACNKERFEDDTSGLSTIMEVINENTEFKIDITYNETMIKNKENSEVFKISDIINSCNQHYLPIFKSLFDKNDYIVDYLKADFIKNYQDFKLAKNQFLLRVGKHSGARAVSIEDIRAIKVELATIQNKKDERKLSEYEQGQKRVEKLKKKAHFENENNEGIIKELFIDKKLIPDNKERSKNEKDYDRAKDFLYQADKLVKLVEGNKKTKISAFLSEETTTWLCAEDSRSTKNLLPFGWLLCEIEDIEKL